MAITKSYIVYLDVCCLNRPFDDQSQARIRLEAEAVLLIMSRLQTDEWTWLGSEVIRREVAQTPDPERRQRVTLLTNYTHRIITIGQSEADRAVILEKLGFKLFDALHIACAESGQADVLLTTDDKLLALAQRVITQLKVRVENPLTWLTEVTES